MITAMEARRNTNLNLHQRGEVEMLLRCIEQKIETAMLKGLCSISIRPLINDPATIREVILHLRGNGFVVKSDVAIEEVSW